MRDCQRPIRLHRFALLALLLAVVLPAHAQVVDLDKDREPLVKLDGKWRFHPGDDPSGAPNGNAGRNAAGKPGWASPDFDDSQWQLLDANHSWYSQGYPGLSGYAWYRFTVQVPAGTRPLCMLLPPIHTSYTVYLDGRQIGEAGNPGGHFFFNTGEFKRFPITSLALSQPRTLHLALRVWHSPIWAGYATGGPSTAGWLGEDRLIARQEQSILDAGVNYFMDLYVDACLRIFIGLLILALYLLRRGEREYLWFALIQLSGAAEDLVEFIQYIAHFLPVQIFDLLDASFGAAFWIAGLFFFATLFRERRRLPFQLCLVLAALSPIPTVFYWFAWVSVPVAAAIGTAMTVPALLWVLGLLIARSWRGDFDARLLLLPTLMVHGFYLVADAVLDAGQLGWLPHVIDLFEWRISLAPLNFGLYTLLNILFLMALMAFLVRRFSRASQHEERLVGELEAARQVQQILVPETAPSIPGFTLEAVYLPAQEVGGDFFQQIADERGGVLLVVGDVSGKGLPAAMMVSMLVGVIRSEAAHSTDPGTLLAALNQRMMGRTNGAFATCIAAHVAASGLCTIANAGHIPPWLNGQALPIEGSLPLGLVDAVQYSSQTLSLKPGDRLTFLSDGVLEASRPATKELFGFERTAAVSMQSAAAIAQAAQAFGQDDDITVLTLERSV